MVVATDWKWCRNFELDYRYISKKTDNSQIKRNGESVMKVFESAVIAAFAICILFGDFFEFYATAQSIEESTLRLHIVAHSDEEIDQAIKLEVRDELLEGTGDLFTTLKSRETALLTAQSHLPLIESIANTTIHGSGLQYDAIAYTTKMYFDTTAYEGFTMPAGYYNAVRIELGDAEGHNWWCVLFPPLCLPSVEGESIVYEMFDEEQAELITSEYDVRFKTLELFEKLFSEEETQQGKDD